MTFTVNGTTGNVFPTWTSTTRPSTPVKGQTGYNTTVNCVESFNGGTWVVLGAQK